VSDGIYIHMSPAMLMNLSQAVSLVRLSKGYGHGGGAFGVDHIVGYFYDSDEAKAKGVLPAHSIGATMDLILAVANEVERANIYDRAPQPEER
jgi:hypothetical protein